MMNNNNDDDNYALCVVCCPPVNDGRRDEKIREKKKKKPKTGCFCASSFHIFVLSFKQLLRLLVFHAQKCVTQLYAFTRTHEWTTTTTTTHHHLSRAFSFHAECIIHLRFVRSFSLLFFDGVQTRAFSSLRESKSRVKKKNETKRTMMKNETCLFFACIEE